MGACVLPLPGTTHKEDQCPSSSSSPSATAVTLPVMTMHTDGPVTARFHIGDAPMDVQAAADAGAVPLGVTTGIYTGEQLLAAAPNATILESLEDLPRVLDLLRQ